MWRQDAGRVRSNGDFPAFDVEECAFAHCGASVDAEQIIWSHELFSQVL
jgi:hypothetical protein